MRKTRSLKVSRGVLPAAILLIGLMLCFLPVNQAHGAVYTQTIDDMTFPFGSDASPVFNTGIIGSYLEYQPRAPIYPQPPAANVLGQARVMTLDVVDGGSSATAWIDSLATRWYATNPSGTSSGAALYWNGTNLTTGCSLPPLTSPADWSQFTQLKLFQIYNDQDTTWTVTIYSNGGLSSATRQFFRGGQPNSREDITILKSQFVGPLDPSTICGISVAHTAGDALDTELQLVQVVTETPTIDCVTPKKLSRTADPASMVQHLVLPQAASFNDFLYVLVQVSNGGVTPSQIDIVDMLPTGMTYAGDIGNISPAGFNLGAATTGPGTVSWSTVDSLAGGATLQFTFKVSVSMTAPSTLTNTYHATAAGDTQYVTDCSGDVTLTNPPSRVPGLNEWGAIILSLLLAVAAILMLRKRRVN